MLRLLTALIFLSSAATSEAKVRTKIQLTAPDINDAALQDVVAKGSQGPAVIRAQILLDRANFSVGEIDGRAGANFDRALRGFQASRNLPVTGTVDAATWTALNADPAEAILTYTIAQQDVDGPFVNVPADMMAKANLPALGYETPIEAVAEKFHVSPGLLKRLNPGKALDKPGEAILVPNVITEIPVKAASIEVSKTDQTVTALDAEGKLIAQYPATIGSEHDPLPIGEWKVTGISRNPGFHYNPDLFWDADPAHAKAKIAPGPNNPVGVVWIDLTKEHYGIHGTPEPSKVGHTQSHGCIRLTNWDAMELANLISRGAKATLKE